MFDIEEYENRRMPSGVTRLKWHIIFHPFNALVFLVILANVLIIFFVVLPWSKVNGTDQLVIPYNNMERDTLSATASLVTAYKSIKLVANVNTNCPGRSFSHVDISCGGGMFNEGEEFTDTVKKAREVVLALETLGILEESEVEKILPNTREERGVLFAAENNENFDESVDEADNKNRGISPLFTGPEVFNKELFCYESGLTFEGKPYKVNGKFCRRLYDLFVDIKVGRRPPLLTVYTWWPGPIFDVQKFSRKVYWTNLNLFRPFIQPVLVTDDRNNMAIANVLGWPCIPAMELGPDGRPLLRPIAKTIKERFKSTFYGYVAASTLFDMSLIHTLLAAKDQLFRNEGHPWKEAALQFEEPGVPFLMSGKTLFWESSGVQYNFVDLHKAVQGGKPTFVTDPTSLSDGYNYAIYSGISFDALPNVTMGGEYVGRFLMQRSILSMNLVVNCTSTVWAAQIFRKNTKSEWNREYISFGNGDKNYNRRLIAQYLYPRANSLRKSNVLHATFENESAISFKTELHLEMKL